MIYSVPFAKMIYSVPLSFIAIIYIYSLINDMSFRFQYVRASKLKYLTAKEFHNFLDKFKLRPAKKE